MIKNNLTKLGICFAVFIMCAFFGIIAANAEEVTLPSEIQETTSVTEPTTSGIKNGFIYIDNAVYYYIDGVMQTGFVKIGKDTYYFNQKGVMQTGLVKVNNKRYYFDSSGKRLSGYMKIGKYNYYFKPKDGSAKTGFWTRVYKKKKIHTYYDSKGRLKTGSFKVDNVKYKAYKKSGEIYYCKNIVKPLCQFPKLPTGCEIVAWTMMAKYAGVKITKNKAVNALPRSSDPNKGFVGNPHSAYGPVQLVYPKGMKSITKKYLGTYKNMTGCTRTKIEKKLYKKRLVLVWVFGLDGYMSHTVALTGYDNKNYFYNDPWTGKSRVIKKTRFMTLWKRNSKRALSY